MAKRNTVNFQQVRGQRGHFGAQVQIKGLRQAQRLMGRLDEDFKKRFKEIHKGAADIVADEARKRVPVGRTQRKSRSYRTYTTGALKKAIRTSGTAKGGIISVGKKKIPYAGRIHFGDIGGQRDRLGRRMDIKPNPFIYRSADIKFRQVVNYYNDELEEILDDAIEVSQRGR